MTSTKTTVLHTQAMHSSSNICRRMKTEDFHYSLRIAERRGLDYGTKVVRIVKVEIRVRFNTSEIVKNFVVLYKIEFKAPKFKWF